MELKKKALDSFDDKRFYTSPFFSIPFSHPDVEKYVNMKNEGKDVSAFEDSKPPHYIPSYFWSKFVQNVRDQKYIDGQGPLFEDFDHNETNGDVLYSIFESSFKNAKNLDLDAEISYTGEHIGKRKVMSQ